MATEAAIKDWVEQTIYDTPPVGGQIEMLKHWPLKYADNAEVGKIWVVPALLAVTFQGESDHELAFLVYHCETKKAEVKMIIKIPEDQLPKYLEPEPKPTPNPDHIIEVLFVPPPPCFSWTS